MMRAVQGIESRREPEQSELGKSPLMAAPVATMGTQALSSYFAFAGIGSAFARTFALASVLRGVRARTLRSIWGVSAFGGLVGMAALIVIRMLGVDDLPRWMEVPTAIVSVQAGFNIFMSWLLSEAGPPLPQFPDLKAGDLAFVLYGAITLPITALFIVVMTATTLFA